MFQNLPSHTSHVDSVRGSDSELLQVLRDGQPHTIDDLKVNLGVTATAVRQRLERLLLGGLVEREKVISGRGRPVFRYLLTIDGHRTAGADASEFAEAMWREVMALRDSPIRKRLVTAIARRLGKCYAVKLANLTGDIVPNGEPAGLEQRMRSLSALLSDHQIPSDVHVVGSRASRLPVLDICACPYPTLRDNPEDRSLCKMEEQMLSEALGSPVHLTSCRLDGDHCCQFTPVAEVAVGSH